MHIPLLTNLASLHLIDLQVWSLAQSGKPTTIEAQSNNH